MVVIQVRDVPEERHRALRLRAVAEGVSLSELIRRELPAIAGRPSMATWLGSLDVRDPATRADGGASSKPEPGAVSPSRIIRGDRDRR